MHADISNTLSESWDLKAVCLSNDSVAPIHLYLRVWSVRWFVYEDIHDGCMRGFEYMYTGVVKWIKFVIVTAVAPDLRSVSSGSELKPGIARKATGWHALHPRSISCSVRWTEQLHETRGGRLGTCSSIHQC
jgi:hypothetical protein